MNHESTAIERDAYRYWLGLMLIHAGSGYKVTRQLIEQHLLDLKNGRPLEHPHPDITAAQWDEENLRRYSTYEAVAYEIIERLVAYAASGQMRDLGLES